MEKTRTSVVIAYRHADERLLKCLQAIEANGPDEIMALSGNLHYQDVQRGLENASGDIILFTDSDTYVPPDWIRRHLSHYPEADMVLGWKAYNLPSLALRNFSAKRAFLLQYGFRSKRWKENFDTDLGLRLMEAKPKFAVDRSIRVVHDHPGGDRFGLRMKRKLRVGMMMLHRGHVPSLADISYFLQTPLEGR